jgi:hypothetical protein
METAEYKDDLITKQRNLLLGSVRTTAGRVGPEAVLMYSNTGAHRVELRVMSWA